MQRKRDEGARSSRASLTAAAAIGGLCGLYGWAVFLSTFGHDGSIGPRYNAPGTDFMVYYAAARAYLDGNLSLLFDGNRFTDHLNEMFAGRLSTPLPFHPWLHPPYYLLILLPFGLLPFGLAYGTFMIATLGALAAALGGYLRESRLKWGQIAALLLCSASAMAALIGAGIVFWSFRRPMPQDLQLAVLLAATIFAAPHVLTYDTGLLVIAAGLLVGRSLEQGIALHRAALMLAV